MSDRSSVRGNGGILSRIIPSQVRSTLLQGLRYSAVVIGGHKISWIQALGLLALGWLLGLVTTAILPYFPRIWNILYMRLGPLFESFIFDFLNKVNKNWASVRSIDVEARAPAVTRTQWLVCVDGSDTSYMALEHAIQLAVPGRDHVVCAFAGEVESYMEPGLEAMDDGKLRKVRRTVFDWTFGVGTIARAKSVLRKRAAAVLNRCKNMCREASMQCSLETLIGRPESVLAEELDLVQADVVVCGSRGMGVVQRMLLGSVSTFLLRQSSVPVMIVKPVSTVPPFSRSRNFLVAADGSPPTLRAFELALSWARPGLDKMFIVCVFKPHMSLHDTQDFLLNCIKLCKDAGVDAVYEMPSGNARREIQAQAEKHDAHYVFLGSRPLPPIQRFTTPSVSDWCVYNLDCPVIVCK